MEFRARRSYLEETEPERFAEMTQMRETGFCLTVLGAAGLGYAFAKSNFFPISPDNNPEELRLAGYVALGGALAILAGGVMEHKYVDYVRKEGRRRLGQLFIGPNGCALAYRF